LHADFRLQQGLEKSCSPCQKLSNGMSQAACMLGIWVDYRLLVVGSQTASLTLGLSFDHNLCLRCPNGQCETILDIYFSIAFQWYKELFEPMGFDRCNCALKIWESIGTPTPNMGVHLRVWRFIPSHSLALLGAWNVTLELPSWLATLQPPCLGREPKARVACVWFTI
jgi:hypothetical protein